MSPEEREDRVQSCMHELREKHGTSFTPMQYWIWCEMIVGGLHASVDDPPTSSMFARAGKNDKSGKKGKSSGTMAEALTQAAVALSTALSPPPRHSTTQAGTSPAKLIESHSKCYKQLSDLGNQKDAILAMLRKLKGD